MLYCDRLCERLVFRREELGVMFCCDVGLGYKESPKFPYLSTGAETMKGFLSNREKIILEELNTSHLEIAKPCEGCRKLISVQDIKGIAPLKEVVFSYYPSPCQCKCIYCSCFGENGNMELRVSMEEAKKSDIIRIISESMEYLRSVKMVTSDTLVHFGSGEITIHPAKDILFESARDCAWRVFTNGFIFDQTVANNLSNNSKSYIDLSLDSGLRETFLHVKQVDKFNDVVANIKKYKSYGRVMLKYIVIPGINDGLADFEGFASIVSEIGEPRAVITWNYHTKGGLTEMHLMSVARLMQQLERRNIKSDILYSFGQVNVDKIMKYMEEL